MTPRTVRARLVGGPKDGWVYDLPTHWELTADKRDVEYVPPKAITTPVGDYLPESVDAEGVHVYRWRAVDAAVDAIPASEP